MNGPGAGEINGGTRERSFESRIAKSLISLYMRFSFLTAHLYKITSSFLFWWILIFVRMKWSSERMKELFERTVGIFSMKREAFYKTLSIP